MFATCCDVNRTVIATDLHHRPVQDHLDGDFAVNRLHGRTIECSGFDIVSDSIAANVHPDGAGLNQSKLRSDLKEFTGDIEARAGILGKVGGLGGMRFLAELGNLPDWLRIHADSLRGLPQGQTVRQRESLGERHPRHFDFGPSDLDGAFIRHIAEGLRGEIGAVMNPMFALVLRGKHFAVETADRVLRIRPIDHPSFLTRTIGCLGGDIRINRQLKDVRAFLVARQVALQGPVLQIDRCEEGDVRTILALDIVSDHHPMPSQLFCRGTDRLIIHVILIPNDSRIVAALLEHGIIFVVGESPAMIVRVGQSFSDACSEVGEHGDDGRLATGLETSRVLMIDHRTTGKALPLRLNERAQSNRQLLPVNQILTDGMTPELVSVAESRRAILVVEMPLTFIVNEAVDVVVPTGLLTEAKLGSQGLGIQVVLFGKFV